MRESTKMYATLFIALLVSNYLAKVSSKAVLRYIELVRADEKEGK